MEAAILVVGVLSLLGTALVGGIFYAFSSFIMGSLERLGKPEGIRAMQSINVVVLNGSFLGVFLGAAILSLAAVGLAVLGFGQGFSPFFMGGGAAYVFGTFLVTGLGNVPLNNKLASAPADDPESGKVWEDYLSRWTRLNHVRTVGALLAAVLFTAGLLVS